jgi:hypothetical protein
VLSCEPERMLSIQLTRAPDSFPFRTSARLAELQEHFRK